MTLSKPTIIRRLSNTIWRKWYPNLRTR